MLFGAEEAGRQANSHYGHRAMRGCAERVQGLGVGLKSLLGLRGLQGQMLD